VQALLPSGRVRGVSREREGHGWNPSGPWCGRREPLKPTALLAPILLSTLTSEPAEEGTLGPAVREAVEERVTPSDDQDEDDEDSKHQ